MIASLLWSCEKAFCFDARRGGLHGVVMRAKRESLHDVCLVYERGGREAKRESLHDVCLV